MNWSGITLQQWESMASVETDDADERIAQYITILFGIENPMDLPFADYARYTKELAFLGNEIEPAKLRSEYKVSGNTLHPLLNPGGISTGRFLDLMNSKTLTETIRSVIEEDASVEDIEQLSITDAMGIARFFVNWEARWRQTSRWFLRRMMRRLKRKMKKHHRNGD